MAKRFNKSLLLRLGLAMSIITALAFIGMLSSVFIADVSEGQAAAINQAGTLRMQSYRIASELVTHRKPLDAVRRDKTQNLLSEFDQRITDARLVGVLAKSTDRELHAAYNKVGEQWWNEIQPLLKNYLAAVDDSLLGNESASLSDLQQDFLARVDGFVANINHLVQVLEMEAEANIQWLRLIQVVSLFLTLGIVLITMYFVYNNVLPPLQDLLASANAARQGNFDYRTRHNADDELGELGDAFNLMAADLSKLYTGLEDRVKEKTSDLERSNRSLELLYKATSRLIESPLSNDVYEKLLDDIQEYTGVGRGSICLGKQNDLKAFKLANTFPSTENGIFKLCAKPDCKGCFDSGESHQLHFDVQTVSGNGVFSIPIKDAEQQYGVLLIELPESGKLEPWQERLLEAVASHIAVALKMAQRTSQSRLIGLLEERGVMARELHDSLAQSLSYLKIQVTRLNAALSNLAPDPKVKEITDELRNGLNSAYRELRELLTTFRLKIDEEGLNRALEKTVAEFNEKSDVAIQLDNHMGNCQLGPNAEIHVIQVVREALSNVVRHSHASQAKVTASYDPDGEVIINIEDNGRGMPDESLQKHHYGLAIMRERAQGLNGKLLVSPIKSGGTDITLIFNLDGKEKFSQLIMQQPKELNQ